MSEEMTEHYESVVSARVHPYARKSPNTNRIPYPNESWATTRIEGRLTLGPNPNESAAHPL